MTSWRRAVGLMACAMGMFASPAPAAAADLSVSLAEINAVAATPADASVVVLGEPLAPCAAPAFDRPIDKVGRPALAETGLGWGLQLAGLAALALAGLVGPRRATVANATAARPPSPEKGQD